MNRNRETQRQNESSSAYQSPACWQPEFLKILPAIERDIRMAFRHQKGEHYDEAVQEAICHCCLAYARLCQQGRSSVASPTSLARYAVAHYRVGRRVGQSMNIKDVTSTYCQRNTGVCVESLTSGQKSNAEWQEMLVENRNVTPADLAASRIDYPAWLSSLGSFRRRIAETLATGETTKRTARLFGLSRARISQLRGEFLAAWQAFHAPKQTTLAET
jgi:hypothetical protein